MFKQILKIRQNNKTKYSLVKYFKCNRIFSEKQCRAELDFEVISFTFC